MLPDPFPPDGPFPGKPRSPAYRIARHVLDLIGPCLREDEIQEAFDEIYEICELELEEEFERRQRWRRPNSN